MASFSFVGPGGGDPSSEVRTYLNKAHPTVADAVYAVERQKSRILLRSQRGQDVNGASFAAYSPAYAKAKQRKYGSSSPVNLQARNKMFQSLQVTVGGVTASGSASTAQVEEFALGFYNEEQAVKARIHNEGGSIKTRLGTGKGKPKKNGKSEARMPRRHFFDASASDLQAMQNDMGARIDARLRG